MENLTGLGNIKIGEGFALFSVNPKIYSLDIIYSASYILLDKAYILLDGDPGTEIKVEIRAKKGQDLKELVYEFNNQLLNYAVYKVQSERNKGLREAILNRVLFTNDPEFLKTIRKEIGDPEEIMKPHPESSGKTQKELFKDEDKAE